MVNISHECHQVIVQHFVHSWIKHPVKKKAFCFPIVYDAENINHIFKHLQRALFCSPIQILSPTSPCPIWWLLYVSTFQFDSLPFRALKSVWPSSIFYITKASFAFFISISHPKFEWYIKSTENVSVYMYVYTDLYVSWQILNKHQGNFMYLPYLWLIVFWEIQYQSWRCLQTNLRDLS